MQEFAKSILNYFATFTETRFRFQTRIAYNWTNDHQTLDLSVFPEFQGQALKRIADGNPIDFDITYGDFTVELDSREFKNRIQESIKEKKTSGFFAECEEKAEKKVKASSQAEDQSKTLEEVESEIFMEAARIFNRSLRKDISDILGQLQDEKKEELKRAYGIRSFAGSSFNPYQIEQDIFDALQNLAGDCFQEFDYFSSLESFFDEYEVELVFYDLYMSIAGFMQYMGIDGAFMCFHEINGGEEFGTYPLFLVEIELARRGDQIHVKNAREILLINTPAINIFKYETILTTPRASRIDSAKGHLASMEHFLQVKYKKPDPFIFQPNFAGLKGQDVPDVDYRVGLQIVKNEDKKILDYSELIAMVESGEGKKFTDLIGTYTSGSIENTADEVNEEYGKRYPRRAVSNLISSIPLSLSTTQKRIITALENSKNKIVVVDGPPGTGKSHLITAITYWGNMNDKTIVITSHKKEALDVIEGMLTNNFKDLHPDSKPSIMRLTKEGNGLNSLDNTLSNAVVNAAERRAADFDISVVEKDQQALEQKLSEANDTFWNNADHYERFTKKLFELEQLTAELKDKGIIKGEVNQKPSITEPGIIDDAQVLAQAVAKHNIGRLSLDSLRQIFIHKEEIPSVLEAANKVNLENDILGDFSLLNEDIDDDLVARFQSELTIMENAFNEDASLGSLSQDDIDVKASENSWIKTITDYATLDNALGLISQLNELNFLGKIKGRSNEIKRSVEELSPELAKMLKSKSAKEALLGLRELENEIDLIAKAHPDLKREFIFHLMQDDSALSLLKEAYQAIRSLELQPVIEQIAAINKTGDFHILKIAQISNATARLLKLVGIKTEYALIGSYSQKTGIEPKDLRGLHQQLASCQSLFPEISAAQLDSCEQLFKSFSELLKDKSITSEDVASIRALGNPSDEIAQVIRLMRLAIGLNGIEPASPPSAKDISSFRQNQQRVVEHANDQRLKNLLQHATESARLKTAISAGRRSKSDEMKILLSSLSCLITEPELISRHLPMEEDIIDLLIIDEASQVSIAESISLILRAKQVIVFGDELQYGAVGAINVSREYSAQYFKNILESYSKELEQIGEEEIKRIVEDVSINVDEEELEATDVKSIMDGRIDAGTKEWLKTLSIRTSTLSFCKALANYSASLDMHFRSYPEIISYSNEYFYRPSQINLIPSRIRTKPIAETLVFNQVATQGKSGNNVNLDEIYAIKEDIERRIANGFKGTIGVITSFREQKYRTEDIFNKELKDYPILTRDNRLTVWFVGDVQGEERDLVYYSFVEDKRLNNADLGRIYPVIGGTADNIRKLKMQRLNVGFSRAKDTMVFVHSMPVEEYSDSRLGDALKHYSRILETASDQNIDIENKLGSPCERELYHLILQTEFYRRNQQHINIIAQFEIGKHLERSFASNIPKYRVDFLLTTAKDGKEQSLIIEYDGVEYHTKDPDSVNEYNFSHQYLDYDLNRQLELESYGYRFLRINKFSLLPKEDGQSKIDVLNGLLKTRFRDFN